MPRTIGITIHLHKADGASIWSNGAAQNCVFLWQLLRAAGYPVFMINGGDADAPPPAMMLKDIEALSFVRFDEVAAQLDVLIECGSQVSAENASKVRARGGRVIAYRFGNSYVIDTERILFKIPSGSVFNGAVFDEVWTNPQHVDTCASYWETCYRCPVRVLPHIWEPTFVDAAIREFTDGLTFGYKPGSSRKRISIFEPNIGVVKTCTIPLLVAEHAFRRRPDLIEHVWVTNTHGAKDAPGMKDHETFINFAMNLDLQRKRKADGNPYVSFEARFNTPYWLAKNTDVVISHQWENGLNYAYYDALYGGYPIVHNSPFLPKGVGYFYEGFDVADGGNVLASVLQAHDAQHEAYRQRADAFLETVRATSPANVEAHRAAIERLFGGS